MRTIETRIADVYRILIFVRHLQQVSQCWSHVGMFQPLISGFQQQILILADYAKNEMAAIETEFSKELFNLKCPAIAETVENEFNEKLAGIVSAFGDQSFDELSKQEFDYERK